MVLSKRIMDAASCLAVAVTSQIGCTTTRLADRCVLDVVPEQAPNCLTDWEEGKREWTAFRADYPGPTQGFALSDPLRGGCRVLIMAEPSPDLDLAEIKAVAPGLLGDARTYKRTLGVDGSLTDAVAILPPVDGDLVDELVASLAFASHGSAYGATLLPYSEHRSKDSFFLGKELDIGVAPQEVLTWLTDRPREVHDRLLGTRTTVEALLADPEPGVYHTGDMVVWPLPRGGSIEDQRAFARRFAVDSDLIVGGLMGKAGVLVIGRARMVPVERLPPMRSETLLSLAGAGTDELAQSYERNRLMAGKLADGTDWAPAMLSEQLHDTEFGWLLNITDNLLKSWSNKGLVRYHGYEWYPEPPRFPFDEPVRKKIDKGEGAAVVYNWNTSGRAVVLLDGVHFALTFNSTSALPMEYNPGNANNDPAVSRLTDEAAEYFRSIGDPTLLRVAQYTSFFQIARFAKLEGTWREARPDLTGKQAVLGDSLRQTFGALLADDPAVESRLRAYVRYVAQDLDPAKWTPEYVERFSVDSLKTAKMIAGMFSDDLDEVAAISFSHELNHRVPNHLTLALAPLSSLSFVFLAAVADQEGMLRDYVAAGAQPLSPWMHTPTVVRSLRADSRATGGHNVSAQATGVIARRDAVGKRTLITVDGGPLPKLVETREIRAERRALAVDPAVQRPELAQQVRTRSAAEAMAPDEILVLRQGKEYVIRSGDLERVAPNRVLASEVVGQVWAKQARKGKGADVKLKFHDMSPEEVEAVSKTLATQSVIKSDALSKKMAFGKRGKQSEQQLAVRFDVDSVRVGEMKVHKPVNDVTLVETTVSAIPSGGNQHGRWFRVKMFFKEKVTDTLLGKLGRLFDGFFKRSGERSRRTIDAVEELQQELNLMKRESPGMRFEILLDDIFLTIEELPGDSEEAGAARADPA